MNKPSVRLHIDELALHGFAAHDAARIAASLREHLALLINEDGMPAQAASARYLARVVLPASSLAPERDPTAIGRELATAIFGRLRA